MKETVEKAVCEIAETYSTRKNIPIQILLRDAKKVFPDIERRYGEDKRGCKDPVRHPCT